jgi:hypothetical protein
MLTASSRRWRIALMISWLVTNWATLFLLCVVVAIAIFLYRRYLIAYEFVYFARKARRLALIKTVIMVALLLLLFSGAEWLLALFMGVGYLRSVLTFVLPFLLLNLFWQATEAWLDRLFYR